MKIISQSLTQGKAKGLAKSLAQGNSQGEKSSIKNERSKLVLFSLVEYYIKTAKPVGSNTLKDVGFADLSSATIRNYFAGLEESGFLEQQHTSGGRIPTSKAYRLYANTLLETATSFQSSKDNLHIDIEAKETRALATFLQKAAEKISKESCLAVFLSAPRFEQDFITSARFVVIDADRCLCILTTDFGAIVTETLYVDEPINDALAISIDHYFNYRLKRNEKPKSMTIKEESLSLKLYNEVMVRYIVNYSQFDDDDIYRTGFSHLLSYPESQDPAILANHLALFEHTLGMRLLLKECCKHQTIKCWICEELKPYVPLYEPLSAVIAIPYFVNGQPVGAIGILGPSRIPYRSLFSLLSNYSEEISESLTTHLYKYKIAMKRSRKSTDKVQSQHMRAFSNESQLLLEQSLKN